MWKLIFPVLFSVYNSLTAIAVCRHFQVPADVIQKALKAAKVKGRIEMVKDFHYFTLMIDYAHNAMSSGKPADNFARVSSGAPGLSFRVRRQSLKGPKI